MGPAMFRISNGSLRSRDCGKWLRLRSQSAIVPAGRDKELNAISRSGIIRLCFSVQLFLKLRKNSAGRDSRATCQF
jgi:hypothetical protein